MSARIICPLGLTKNTVQIILVAHLDYQMENPHPYKAQDELRMIQSLNKVHEMVCVSMSVSTIPGLEEIKDGTLTGNRRLL